MSGRYWIGTTKKEEFLFPSPLQRGVVYVKGQEEQGEGGFRHIQWVVLFDKSVRLSFVRKQFAGHWELTRSEAAVAYVWKESTSVDGSKY